MERIVADTDAMKNIAVQMNKIITTERSNLDDMRGIIISLHEHWKGKSHDAFIENYYNSVDSRMPQYLDKVEELISEMEKTAENFDMVENNCKKKLDSIEN